MRASILQGRMTRTASYSLFALALGITFGLGTLADCAKAPAKPKRTDGPPPMELADGTKYTGAAKGEKPHGIGRKVLPTGEVFEGEFLDGVLHGAGLHMSAAGDTYKGGFVHGEREGQGEAEWTTGELYRGGWKVGLRHGYGVQLLPSGDAYKGEWVMGVKEGRGEELLASGETFRGTFRAGKRHGVGVVTSAEGSQKRVYYLHGQQAPVPPLADNFAAQSEDDLPYMWRGSPEHPEIMEERAQMDMLTDERGRLMRTAGAFPLTTSDFLLDHDPLTLARNGVTERELVLGACARAKPTAMDTIYDLFSSGDFFAN